MKLRKLLLENSIKDRLFASRTPFITWGGKPSDNGMKLSIQGRTIDDAVELFEKLSPFLRQNSIAFKVGTNYLINMNHPTQSTKLMTIYVPNDVEFEELAEEIYKKIMNYKGWKNIKTPPKYQHYAGGIFYRNDRDEDGKYIPGKSN